ncbi:signal recognition particle-docking protein FtsY [Kocuria palustris]|jgi:fused signal recognition particle receptor|uniref:signal recognition particle-docking protein FtsY n=1 Tax=Kocuria palustris TaxID=71999 RepID=UPI0019D3092B|nr:signal recognition particle-docking protein FtsY [Kocuria palustris]MBN6752246.1 signal recognition particle-docking protein FtsY [Kocuria palustris]MBN6757201.1 signal recognition particle-docking protein FtsY [Kocuria palustris]MBN6762229.1 signal recognition particle-docking protein FtsY [Kocuria palustris]MBN6781711.1 signal recognition particle-docking protein FtsY [Kocuria palustris]MBN6798195.1 signal recognition particle-docking protein FtsY [Kocuria palustris]
MGDVDQILAQIPVFVYVLIAVVVLALLGFVLLRGPKAPPGGYDSTRDADDPAPGASGDGSDEHARAGGGTATETKAPSLDTPESAGSRMARLRGRLAKSNNVFGRGLLALLSRDHIDQDVWDEIEETLLMADLGTDASMELVENLQVRVKAEGTQDPNHVKAMLREELLKLVDPSMDRSLAVTRKGDTPAVMLVVGVNGVGKTTTVGKLARVLVAEDKDVMLGAADTFRAAAADQLQTWGNRVGVPTVRSEVEGADPASVAFDAVKTGIDSEVDVVMIDTAGRLQNKAGLMDQLGKIKRVVEKAAEVDEVLLVIDATTGQNGMTQARVFSEAVNVTGIALTKLDGTAKGGIVVAIQRELGAPVKLIGLGEGADDLAPFDAEQFVDALLE